MTFSFSGTDDRSVNVEELKTQGWTTSEGFSTSEGYPSHKYGDPEVGDDPEVRDEEKGPQIAVDPRDRASVKDLPPNFDDTISIQTTNSTPLQRIPVRSGQGTHRLELAHLWLVAWLRMNGLWLCHIINLHFTRSTAQVVHLFPQSLVPLASSDPPKIDRIRTVRTDITIHPLLKTHHSIARCAVIYSRHALQHTLYP